MPLPVLASRSMHRRSMESEAMKSTSSNPSSPTPKKGSRKFDPVDSLLSEDGPMDESEQEQLLYELERLQLQQSRMWMRIFAILAALLASFYGYSAYSQSAHPWELRHVGEFASVVQHTEAIVWLAVQSTSLWSSSFGLLDSVPGLDVGAVLMTVGQLARWNVGQFDRGKC
eukprot:gene17029-23321_t